MDEALLALTHAGHGAIVARSALRGDIAVWELAENPFWGSLRQDVWEQHFSCASQDEAISRAIALVDDRVGDLLARRRPDKLFGRVTSALLTVAADNYYRAWNVHWPAGLDPAGYVQPAWTWVGVFAAHDRLGHWADLALRFRDRQGGTAPMIASTAAARPMRTSTTAMRVERGS